MAEAPKPDKTTEQSEAAPQKQTSGKTAWWRRLLTRRWLAILLLASILVHGIGFAYFRLTNCRPPAVTSPEVRLGAFRFEADDKEASRITNAEFSLHIALLEHVDGAARQRLDAYRFRVQQDVEELLRRAHGGDFDDPSLGELKRQLQERINETLGMRVIAEVIITDLKLRHNNQDVGLVTGTAESVPWVEKPSS
jgi:flagellar basal body-associated protein FliL